MFLSNIAVVFSFILLESLRFACFFLVCYYFCHKAVNVLLRSKNWLYILKVFLIINVNWVVIALVIIELQTGFIENYKDYALCFQPVFLVLRSGGELVTILFTIIGILITRSILKYQNTEVFIQPEQRVRQRKALKNLWIVIGTFFLVVLDLIIYDSFMYYDSIENCDIIIEHNPALNEFVWIIQRSITHLAWLFPIIYVFWPKIVKEKSSLVTEIFYFIFSFQEDKEILDELMLDNSHQTDSDKSDCSSRHSSILHIESTTSRFVIINKSTMRDEDSQLNESTEK